MEAISLAPHNLTSKRAHEIIYKLELLSQEVQWKPHSNVCQCIIYIKHLVFPNSFILFSQFLFNRLFAKRSHVRYLLNSILGSL